MTDKEIGKVISEANEADKRRTICTKCGLTFKSYELQPGTGYCTDCMS